MITYITKDQDTLDEVVFRYYGETKGYLEKVLAENRHLAGKGDFYKAGIIIKLPDIDVPKKTKKTLSLWD
ncbi:MAG: tail protein X [Oligoflexales bacterium]